MHTNTAYAPVNHGGVAGVHVDADAIARFGISSTADSVQTLQHAKKLNELNILNEKKRLDDRKQMS